MHEMSIAVELMSQLEAVAAANGMTTIEEVTISAGALRAIVPEALDMAFEALAMGTCAAGAKLVLEIVSPRGRCRTCGREFGVEIDNFTCPHCNLADVEVIAGNEIILASVTGQGPEGDGDGED